MVFQELLQNNKEAIIRRWFEDVLAMYPGDTVVAFKRQKDPFANPVGHSLRVGTEGIFEWLVEGGDDEKIRQHLLEILKVRAVQEFSASRAVGFVFKLKDAIRAELGAAMDDAGFSSEVVQLEKQIDQIALKAFDVFVACREQVCELRVNEMKRSVGWFLDKMNKRESEAELVQLDSDKT